jgi:hypothetical protein
VWLLSTGLPLAFPAQIRRRIDRGSPQGRTIGGGA